MEGYPSQGSRRKEEGSPAKERDVPHNMSFKERSAARRNTDLKSTPPQNAPPNTSDRVQKASNSRYDRPEDREQDAPPPVSGSMARERRGDRLSSQVSEGPAKPTQSGVGQSGRDRDRERERQRQREKQKDRSRQVQTKSQQLEDGRLSGLSRGRPTELKRISDNNRSGAIAPRDTSFLNRRPKNISPKNLTPKDAHNLSRSRQLLNKLNSKSKSKHHQDGHIQPAPYPAHPTLNTHANHSYNYKRNNYSGTGRDLSNNLLYTSDQGFARPSRAGLFSPPRQFSPRRGPYEGHSYGMATSRPYHQMNNGYHPRHAGPYNDYSRPYARPFSPQLMSASRIGRGHFSPGGRLGKSRVRGGLGNSRMRASPMSPMGSPMGPPMLGGGRPSRMFSYDRF